MIRPRRFGMAYQQIGSFQWSAPSFIVNQREAMRFRAMHIVAGKHGDYELAGKIALASVEPVREGEWTDVLDD
jgi:hypothetical protein